MKDAGLATGDGSHVAPRADMVRKEVLYVSVDPLVTRRAHRAYLIADVAGRFLTPMRIWYRRTGMFTRHLGCP